jgi:hypothetical protein
MATARRALLRYDRRHREIYSLGRESFFGGQKSFQLQAYPFKMTPINMAKHRNNPNMPFWKMIKQGYDHFEVTRQEPKVEFCEKKYVFDATKAPDAKRDPVFEASAKCPAYAIPEEVADAVREKQQQDQVEIAKLISRGTPVARANPGIDGGMNRVFAAKLPDGSTGLSEGGDGQGLSLAALSRAPGTIPAHVNPPRGPVTAPEQPLAASMTPAPAPAATTRVASAAPSDKSDGFFSSPLPARSAWAVTPPRRRSRFRPGQRSSRPSGTRPRRRRPPPRRSRPIPSTPPPSRR